MKQIEWSEKQRSTIQKSFRHCLEVEEGTPRSGKTTCAVARFAWFLWNTPDQNHLVLAYNQEQAFRLVMDCDGLGLLHVYQNLTEQKHDDFGDYVLLHAPNGGKKVYYKGAGKADSHKAFTGLSLGSVFFCEINLLHMNAIQEAFRRTMAAKIRWHIADLNPPAPNHPVIDEVFNVQDRLQLSKKAFLFSLIKARNSIPVPGKRPDLLSLQYSGKAQLSQPLDQHLEIGSFR